MNVRVGREAEDHIEIDVAGRMHPHATDYWDGNWLISPLRVSVGPFSGVVGAALRAEELVAFRVGLEELYATLGGEAQLKSLEDWIELTATGDGRGKIAVAGYVRDTMRSGNSVTFSFEIDQSDLPEVIAGLRDLEQDFPVLGTPAG